MTFKPGDIVLSSGNKNWEYIVVIASPLVVGTFLPINRGAKSLYKNIGKNYSVVCYEEISFLRKSTRLERVVYDIPL